MDIKPKVRVLIVDDQATARDQLFHILQGEGFDVHAPEGTGSDLVIKAIGEAQAFRPHVAIIDLRLVPGSSDISGLKIIKELGYGQKILYSAYLTPSITREAWKDYGFYDCVEKTMDPQELIKVVMDAAAMVSATQRGLKITRPDGLRAEEILRSLELTQPLKDGHSGIVDDVLAMLFPNSEEITINIIGESTVSPTKVGGSHSIVFEVSFTDTKPARKPALVKLAPAHHIEDEYEKYIKYVKNRLGGSFYPAIEQSNTFIFYELGGICYSLLDISDKNKLVSFTDFYKISDSDKLIMPLNHLFGEIWAPMYRNRTEPKSGNLFEYYKKTYQENFSRLSTRNFKSCSQKFGISFVNPVSFINNSKNKKDIPDPYPYANTHGDLNADNILTDGIYSWVIDFDYSGFGPIFRDFATLEIDILCRVIDLPIENPNLLIKLVSILCKQENLSFSLEKNGNITGALTKPFDFIEGLRKLIDVITNFVNIDSYSYYWELLLQALRYSSVSDKSISERARIISIIIAIRLKNWGGQWPPIEIMDIIESKR